MNLQKKIAGLLLVAGTVICPLSGQAQTGEKSLGLMGGYSSYNNSGYLGVDFQYSFASHVRIAPDIAYSFKNEGKSAFILDVDMHFPFAIAKGVGIYPLVGFAFNNWSYEGGGHANRAGANFGGGFDFNLTSDLKLSLQAKYSLMKDTDGAFVGVGIGYRF